MQDLKDRLSNCICRATDRLFSTRISSKRQTAKNGQQPHISHTQPRQGGRFVKAQASAQPPLKTPLTARAPNAGQPVVPHVTTFQGLIQSISSRRTYLPPDTAVKQSRIEADTMLLDPAIKAPLNERFRGTTGAAWHIEPDDATDPEQVDMAAGLTRMVKKIPRFRKYLFNLLMAEFHGRYAINNVYNWVFDGDDRYITATNWVPVHGDKLVFDENGEVGVKVGATIQSWMVNKVDEHGRRSLDQTIMGRVYWFDEWTRPLYTVHHGEIRDGLYEDVWSAGSIFGLGIRHHVYWPYWLKQDCMAAMVDALSRLGTGLRIYYYTEGNPESLQSVKRAAEAQSGENNILFPRPLGKEGGGPGIETVELSGEGLDHMKDIIRDYFDGQIRQLIIGQELSATTGKSGTGLGSGVGEQHAHTKSEIVKEDAASLGETLTKELLVPLAAFNYPRQPMRCSFVFDVDDSERQELLAASKLFFDMGGEIDADHLRGELGLPKPEPGAEVLKKAAAPAVDPAGDKQGSPFSLTAKPKGKELPED
jgi:phage gp29-like protein